MEFPHVFYYRRAYTKYLKNEVEWSFTNNQYPINGYGTLQGVNTSGYLLLGNDNITQQNQPSLYTSKGAFSLLHLNGIQNSGGGGFTQEFGYRPWMQTGIINLAIIYRK